MACVRLEKHGTLNSNQFGWLDTNSLTEDEYIKDETTDTVLMIVSVEDFIIIAFKGTTSTQNIMTYIKFIGTLLSKSLPTVQTDFSQEVCETREWKMATAHKGFLDGYASVSKRILDCVSRLIPKKARPVLLTGHSLGGALATVCSLDLRLSLGIAESNILASSFGSPKIGNYMWSTLYDR